MTPLYACPQCGTRSKTRRCPEHTRSGNTSWAGNRDRAKQARFRKEVLKRDGYRCTWVDPETEERCTETEDLRAAHLRALAEFETGDPMAYSARFGTTLCPTHDRMLDPHAR